ARPALPAMMQAIANQGLEVRLQAIREMRNFGQQAAPATSALIDCLQDKDTRFPAIYAMEAIGPGAKEAIPALQKLMQKGSPNEAKAASQALRRIQETKTKNP